MVNNTVRHAFDSALAHLFAIALEFIGNEVAVSYLSVFAHEAGMARIISTVEVVPVAGFTSDGFAVFTGQGEGLAFRGFPSVSKPIPRMMKASFRSDSHLGGASREAALSSSAKLHLARGIGIVRRLRTPFGGIDEREAIFDPGTEFAVAAVGLLGRETHFLDLFPQGLGGSIRRAVKDRGLGVIDGGEARRIEDGIPFVKFCCARRQRWLRWSRLLRLQDRRRGRR